MSDLKPGMMASVPLSGICSVVAVEETEILGDKHRMVVLEPQDGEGQVKVPAKQLEARGIRPLAEPETLTSLLEGELDVEPPAKVPPHRRIKKWTRILRQEGVGARPQVLLEMAALAESGAKISKKERAFEEKVRLNFRREMEEVLELSPIQAGLRLSNFIN